MMSDRFTATAAHLRNMASDEIAEHGDERARTMAHRLELLARFLDQDAIWARRFEDHTVPASARAGLSVVTAEDAAS